MSSNTHSKNLSGKNRLEVPKIEVHPPEGSFGQGRPRAPSYENLHRTAFNTPVAESEKAEDFVKWERANEMIKRSNFQGAIGVLENLGSAQRQQLMLTECYLQLGKMRNAMKCVEKLEEIMTSPPLKPPSDVMDLIVEYISARSYIRALILLSCTSKLYLSFPDQALDGITTCAEKCSDVIIAMSQIKGRNKIIAQDLGIEMINDMLTRLRSVTNHDDANAEVKKEAECLNYIALCYRAVSQKKKSLEYFLETEDLLNSVFVGDASKHFQYDTLLRRIGYNYYTLENYSTALEYYMKTKEFMDSLYAVDDTKNSGYIDVLHGIGRTHFSLGQHSEALEYFMKTKKGFESLYGCNAHKRCDYGVVHKNIALAYSSLENYAKAQESLTAALAIFHVAEDWNDAKEKSDRISQSNELMVEVENNLKLKQGALRRLFRRK